MTRTIIFDDRPPHKILLDESRQVPFASWNHGAIVWLEKPNGERLWAVRHFCSGRGLSINSDFTVLDEYEVPNEIKATMLLLI